MVCNERGFLFFEFARVISTAFFSALSLMLTVEKHFLRFKYLNISLSNLLIKIVYKMKKNKSVRIRFLDYNKNSNE